MYNEQGFTHSHESEGLSLGFLSLRQMKVHLISIKIGIVGSAHTLIEPERPVGHHFSLQCTHICTCDIGTHFYMYTCTRITSKPYTCTYILTKYISTSVRYSVTVYAVLTKCAMMLSLWRDGCLLNRTTSPSIR